VAEELKITLAQLNPTVGNVHENIACASFVYSQAEFLGTDLLVFPELFVSGYPPEDLVLKRAFLSRCAEGLDHLTRITNEGTSAILTGVPWRVDDKVYNAAAHLELGQLKDIYFKVLLPNYGPFEEKRTFNSGSSYKCIEVKGTKIGVLICEDLWTKDASMRLANDGAELLIVLNSSPYCRDKYRRRMEVATSRVKETNLPLIYLNQIGGQDELVFDGASFGLQRDASLAFQLPAFEKRLACVTHLGSGGGLSVHSRHTACEAYPDKAEANWHACVLGLRDYLRKNNYEKVVMGLSGGIDSSVVAAMCVDAVGSDNVHAVMMPYTYTSDQSLEDASACAAALEISRYQIIPIDTVVNAIRNLSPDHRKEGIVEENIQARARGTILMTLSNSTGAMLISTGNKSEISVGYCTLYGDMNGGFSPIKDLYKTEVYECARWRNAHSPYSDSISGQVIPSEILEKAPSAELRPDQTDQDTLPPYHVLDDILLRLVEQDATVAELVDAGFDPVVTLHVQNLLYASEHKRRQSPPGVKVTECSFGRERRYPITNRFREVLKQD